MAGGSLPEDELAQVDAVGLAALIRDGQLSPVEAVQATIDRIERLDGEINAVIHRQFDQALALAASPDLPDGPFRGVPMLIKDLWATEAGHPHHGGVRALKDAGFTADEDANLVTRYKEAGFVIVGRTNTPELGLVATTEPTSTGPCRNPWNTGYSTGGAAGGAAAAVATGMVPAANASDGGGSIRIPAAMCGLVGLKPSRGRVSQGPAKSGASLASTWSATPCVTQRPSWMPAPSRFRATAWWRRIMDDPTRTESVLTRDASASGLWPTTTGCLPTPTAKGQPVGPPTCCPTWATRWWSRDPRRSPSSAR